VLTVVAAEAALAALLAPWRHLRPSALLLLAFAFFLLTSVWFGDLVEVGAQGEDLGDDVGVPDRKGEESRGVGFADVGVLLAEVVVRVRVVGPDQVGLDAVVAFARAGPAHPGGRRVVG
jgi:hypothetical protein